MLKSKYARSGCRRLVSSGASTARIVQGLLRRRFFGGEGEGVDGGVGLGGGAEDLFERGSAAGVGGPAMRRMARRLLAGRGLSRRREYARPSRMAAPCCQGRAGRWRRSTGDVGGEG